ncbi:bcl-2-like protein 11 isoform X2 [Micropterus salmoides]|uniref:bcl-2-like protein 11 isoform X2 n=1 Tax=Micropterus salmoides TaxID=27706 RepID=UPI0018ED71BF|nr:bcl-2-like protein 11 isoform X2 [Micropterus salmoides]
MQLPSRPPNRSDGSTAVTATQGSGGDPPPVGAAGASAQTSRSDNCGERSFGHPDPPGGGEPDSPYRTTPISPIDSLGVFQTRSIFHLPRRASSGYFSCEGDSLPSSPLSPRPLTADIGTQTPSHTSQMVKHAQERMAETHGRGPGMHQQHGHSPRPSSSRPRNAARDMQTEAIGRELQRIGDDYNRLLRRREAVRLRRVVIYPNPLPHIRQEPTMLFCVGLLLLLIGRIIYLQGSTNSQDHSQV